MTKKKKKGKNNTGGYKTYGKGIQLLYQGKTFKLKQWDIFTYYIREIKNQWLLNYVLKDG